MTEQENAHYLAVNHESYDGDTIFGVFDTFYAARDFLESDAAEEVSSSARHAVVEEWEGAEWTAVYERSRGGWDERRFTNTRAHE